MSVWGPRRGRRSRGSVRLLCASSFSKSVGRRGASVSELICACRTGAALHFCVGGSTRLRNPFAVFRRLGQANSDRLLFASHFLAAPISVPFLRLCTSFDALLNVLRAMMTRSFLRARESGSRSRQRRGRLREMDPTLRCRATTAAHQSTTRPG